LLLLSAGVVAVVVAATWGAGFLRPGFDNFDAAFSKGFFVYT